MITIPPFCPNSECPNHDPHQLAHRSRASPWYQRDGSYSTALRRRILRFRCPRCGRRFSSQTFSLDYAVKRPLPYRRIFEQLNSGSGIRSLARNLQVSEKVILNRIGRLARQSLALQAQLRPLLPLHEELAADGFESFCLSQYFPNNIHLLVGKSSQYLYAADYAHLRRKGRMREEQKRRRRQLETLFPPVPGELQGSFERLMHHLLRCLEGARGVRSGPLRVYTDEKLEYARVIGGPGEMGERVREGTVVHVRLSSKRPRTLSNDLFAVNYYDRELRKDQGNHVRESVEFSRNVNNCMERLWVYAAYHNYVKPYRVARRGMKGRSHAQEAGIERREIAKLWKRFFTCRWFVSQLDLSCSERYVWYRCYRTPLKMSCEELPSYLLA